MTAAAPSHLPPGEPPVPLTEVGALVPLQLGPLPLFHQDLGAYTLFYAPNLVTVVARQDVERFQVTVAPFSGDPSQPGPALWQQATNAVKQLDRLRDAPFSPECLTLYLHNACNLRCSYCYAAAAPGSRERLDLDAIAAAGRVVAAACRAKGLPFTVVLHGGGEPALIPSQVEQVQAALAAVAAQHAVTPFWYIATNGVMPEAKARWLARRFDLVGLSCDGPPDIQDRQRPRHSGAATSRAVERTARILREEGKRIHVRTTITPASLAHQAEIAAYLCQTLAPTEIQIEPVYAGGRSAAGEGFLPRDAGGFVAHFLQARSVAQSYGVRLATSGSRPGTIHGPYCNVFRQVVNLVPGGIATACFKLSSADQVREAGAAIGAYRAATGAFELDLARIATLRRTLGALPASCSRCFNATHCTWACPDRCPIAAAGAMTGPGHPPIESQPGFRCQVARTLTYAALRETAQALWTTLQTPWDENNDRIRCATAAL